ncbi:glycosyltransferase [Novipirellula artificiosorum]|uniref:GDP-mannose-dependent alpha-(1-6)-phosphatidylinositol monomannoside mannosyltransferase n=1 Tax=Novipirellula artificiosorum TaxID=2528016 RepID=A0A5C6DRC6_9BACT|nr:glycosyltransferase [Novipirellula artificiosorum]TWU39202.1 GDP-mannose-dependent alpha-(1-6)-phosphatidylinositol monomannoside mannosyltransferase [Novipirellula artificiosorum]
MNVALAHHWLASYRGGEKVLEQIASLFPQSDIYTLVRNLQVHIPGLAGHPIHESPLNLLPYASRAHRHLLPLHPLAIKMLRVHDHVDALISSDASMIKGLSIPKNATHICYCHSPPRYLWELGAEYKRTSFAARFALDRVAPMLRRFDWEAAQRVTHFIANSQFVADRIRKYYDRDAEVIHPPVAVDDFCPTRERESFSLVISELVSYKRIDIAIKAFNELGQRLVVIGDGPERKKLETLAKPNIQFLGRQPFPVLKEHFETAAAFIFPGIEDFGITPVEAQAAGCPVVAYRAGGALETVLEGRTGVFFDTQNPESLMSTLEELRPETIAARDCRENAETFSAQIFRQRLAKSLAKFNLSVAPQAVSSDECEKPTWTTPIAIGSTSGAQ